MNQELSSVSIIAIPHRVQCVVPDEELLYVQRAYSHGDITTNIAFNNWRNDEYFFKSEKPQENSKMYYLHVITYFWISLSFTPG
jgi:hypothetical protein